MSDPIECPKCGSKAHDIGMSIMTVMMYRSYTDHEGKRHIHDPNERNECRTCSDCGIAFSVITYGKCWCGWSAGTDKITWDDTK